MNHSLLADNEAKRLNIRLPLLICFAMFAAWQIGMVYFSGQTLSVDGRTPLPVNVDKFPIFMVAGYLLSIVVMIIKPSIIVWIERITVSITLLSALALYLPLAAEILGFILYLQIFCCFLMTGFETALIVSLFTEKTAVIHLTVAYGIVHLIVAALHNDFIKIDFSLFRLFSIISLAMMIIFFFKIPGNSWPQSVKKSDGLVVPKSMFAGVFLWSGMLCLIGMFSHAIVEGVTHGIFIYYISGVIFSFIIFLLWKFFGISIFRSVYVLVALGVMGFVTSIASLYIPALLIIACVLLGAVMIGAWLIPLFGNILIFKRYPSRFVAPGIIGTAFIAVIIHTSLLDNLRNNLTVLYIVYLIIAVALTILYLMMEPYLFYSFRNHSLVENVNINTGEQMQEITNSQLAEQSTEEMNQQNKNLSENLKAETLDNLSYQELRITELSLRGHTYKEIANALVIKPNTVKWYMKEIYSKLQIHSKAELFNLAHKQRAESREQ